MNTLTKSNRKAPKAIYFTLGYIGHKAEKLQQVYAGYSEEPNEYGMFLKFENTTDVGNKGVMVYTNCFKTEAAFKDNLLTKILFSI